MTALLKIYDDISSNQYVSLGVSVATTAFVIYKVATKPHLDAICFCVGLVAGVAFALLADTLLRYSKKLNTKEDWNTYHTTTTLIIGLLPAGFLRNRINMAIYDVVHFFKPDVSVDTMALRTGFAVGFLGTNLLFQAHDFIKEKLA